MAPSIENIKPVIQQDVSGCGIASAAALAGMDYAEAKRVAAGLGITPTDSTLWSDPRPLRHLLETLGLRLDPKERPFIRWDALPDRAVLAIKWHLERGVPHWHWVVFIREDGAAVVLDPKKTLRDHRRTDFGRIKPKWFIEVKATA